jgi:hypothetical protein
MIRQSDQYAEEKQVVQVFCEGYPRRFCFVLSVFRSNGQPTIVSAVDSTFLFKFRELFIIIDIVRYVSGFGVGRCL